MPGQHHYVAQFHLRGFSDPVAGEAKDPWLWVADCKTGVIRRRAPKNFAWSRGLFDGPGGLADREATLESFLANEVEGPAAKALRNLTDKQARRFTGIPPELGRYLAWATARSLPMKALYESWIETAPVLSEVKYAEPPPPGLGEWTESLRTYRMEHSVHGLRDEIPPDQVEPLRAQGWRLCLGNDDFLEFVHLQAWYFQVRFFPRLKWLSLGAPRGQYFIIGDRPVVWGFSNLVDAAYWLRHPDVQLVAPLSRSLALFAYHASNNHPDTITTGNINRIIASAAHEWIAGPTESVVRDALLARVYH
jgi:uncharacterized protein DUF4238